MARPCKIALAFALIVIQASMLCAGSVPAELDRPEPALKWRSKVITIALSSSLLRPASNVKYGSDLVGAVRRSLRAWEDAGAVEFREVFSDKQSVSPQGPSGDGVSLITVAPTAENSLLFAKNAEEVAATTRVFFDGRGRISEADIVLNPYQQFSSDGTFGTFDLESTLTHEIGHVLGLEHSNVRGATMYENFGRNGVFGLQGFSHRTLSEIDLTAFRAKYGSPSPDEACCGAVSTKILLPDGRPAADVEVWLEDAANGRVVAQSTTGGDGSADFAGVRFGSYSVYSGRKDRAKRPIPMQSVGTVTVSESESPSLTRKLTNGVDDVEIRYTGFNGQLTLSSVPLNAGKSYTVYIGGRNLSAKGTSISFNSPFLSVTPGSLVSLDYGSDLTALSFEVTADPKTPVGDYTILVESAAGGRSAAAGAISIRTFSNPFSNLTFETR